MEKDDLEKSFDGPGKKKTFFFVIKSGDIYYTTFYGER